MNILSCLNLIMGWTYFLAWSISFYPFAIENWYQKSVKGININFIALNLTGFICLSVYCTVGYLDHDHFYGIGNIHIEDIAFAYHAAILTLVVVVQYFIYPIGNNKLSKGYIVLLSIIWTLIPIFLYLTLKENSLLKLHLMKQMNVFKLMGYTKVFVSLIKYIPQVWWNYVRQSTKGWNIWSTILDFIGGVFSILQIIFDKLYYEPDLPFNEIKLELGILSLFYDSILMYQHYVLYDETKKKNKNMYVLEEEDVKHI